MGIHISNSEWEVLNIMWKVGTPLHTRGILDCAKDKTWKDSYIHILLNKMLEKGLIKEAGFTRSGKVWARLYTPGITPEECCADIVLSGAFNPVSIVKMIIKRPDMDKKTLDMLRDIIDKAQTEKENKEY